MPSKKTIDNLKDQLLWEKTSKQPGMYVGESPSDIIKREIEFWEIKLHQLNQ